MGFKRKNESKKDGRKQKGQKKAEQEQRVRHYKKKYANLLRIVSKNAYERRSIRSNNFTNN